MPLMPGAPLVVTAALLAPLTAAAVSVPDLPPESFQLRPASWLFRGQGLINVTDAVYNSLPADSLCECMARCFVDENCVSLSFTTDSTDVCKLNAIRGSPQNTQPADNVMHRIRPGLAVLDDWCEEDSDCSLLTTGPTSCVDNLCQCASGYNPEPPRSCVSGNAQSTTDISNTASPASATSPTTADSESTTDATGTGITSSTETQATTASSSPTASAATEATTASSASTSSATTGETTASSAATMSSTTEATSSATTEATTASSAPTSSETTEATTVSTSQPSSEATEATTSTAATTTAATTTAPTTAATTTTVSTTTAEGTTTETTTTTTMTTTTVAAPVAAVTRSMWKPRDYKLDTEGEYETEYPHTWSCIDGDSRTWALFGLYIGGAETNHVHGWDCADFSSLNGFGLDISQKTYIDVQESAENSCPENQMMVGFLDENDRAHSVDLFMCVPVSGGYMVDCDQIENHEIAYKENTYCGTNYAITQIRLGPQKRFEAMRCCKVVPSSTAPGNTSSDSEYDD